MPTLVLSFLPSQDTDPLLGVLLRLNHSALFVISLSFHRSTMKSTFGIIAFIVLAGVAFAHPLPRADSPSGTWVIISPASRGSSSS
jgi:hypothetical protein